MNGDHSYDRPKLLNGAKQPTIEENIDKMESPTAVYRYHNFKHKDKEKINGINKSDEPATIKRTHFAPFTPG